MNSDELAALGRSLYGARWQTALALALGVNDRTVRRWLAGDRQIPPPTALAIRAVAEKPKPKSRPNKIAQ